MNLVHHSDKLLALLLTVFLLPGCGTSGGSSNATVAGSDDEAIQEESVQLTESQEDVCADAAQVATDMANLTYVLAPVVETAEPSDSGAGRTRYRGAAFGAETLETAFADEFGQGVQVERLSDDPLTLGITFDAVETSRGTSVNGYLELTVQENGDVLVFSFSNLKIENKQLSGDLTVTKLPEKTGFSLEADNLQIVWATRKRLLEISLSGFQMTLGSDDTITTNGDVTIETDGRTVEISCNDLVVDRTEVYPTGEVSLTVDDLEVNLIFDGTSKVKIEIGDWFSWRIHLPESIIEETLGRHLGSVRTVSFSPQNDFVASGGVDGHIKIWSVGSRRLYRPIVAFDGSVYSVAYSPDGSMLAAGGYNGILKIYSTEGYAEIAERELGHPINSIAWSPDQTMLVTGMKDTTVRIFRLQEGTLLPLGVLTGNRDRVLTVAWSPDGRTVASGGVDKYLRIWDVSDGAAQATLRYELEGHDTKITGIDFFPSGKLVSVGTDTHVVVWDVEEGQILKQGFWDVSPILGFACVTTASDNHWFVVGSFDSDPMVSWWYPDDSIFQTLTGFRSVEANGDDTNSLDLSPNRAYLASGSADGYVKLFRGIIREKDLEEEE